MILYRPVGTAELKLIEENGWKAFPPRLPEQPIFYPVLNEKYAREIAYKWNAKHNEDHKGYVLCFEIDDEYISRFDVHTVGSSYHQELWIPAEELNEFNQHIIGLIQWLDEYAEETKAEAEVKVLWKVFREKQTLFERDSLQVFDPFLLGLGSSLCDTLGYNMAWRGPFHAFVCRQYKVFNWDVIDKKMSVIPKPLAKTEYKQIIIELCGEEEKKSKYIVVNWLNALEDNYTDEDAFSKFFELLQEYRPDLYNEPQLLPFHPGTWSCNHVPELLLQYENRLGLLIGTVNSFRLDSFFRGFLWSLDLFGSNESTDNRSWQKFYSKHGDLLSHTVQNLQTDTQEEKERISLFMKALRKWYESDGDAKA